MYGKFVNFIGNLSCPTFLGTLTVQLIWELCNFFGNSDYLDAFIVTVLVEGIAVSFQS